MNHSLKSPQQKAGIHTCCITIARHTPRVPLGGAGVRAHTKAPLRVCAYSTSNKHVSKSCWLAEKLHLLQKGHLMFVHSTAASHQLDTAVNQLMRQIFVQLLIHSTP
jgi:hypothetical protein